MGRSKTCWPQNFRNMALFTVLFQTLLKFIYFLIWLYRLFSFCEKLDQPLYCSYTYRDTGATPCKLHVVLDVESGHLTQHIIMGSVKEAGLDSGTQNVNSEPVSTGTVGGRSDIYVQPLSSTELEALFPSIWFHGTQNDQNGAAHEQWLTR